MTPAELDTRRRMLGLSVDETAALCGVQDRQIRRWQSGAQPIARDVPARLEALEEAMEHAVEEIVALATDKVLDGPVTLWRYRTAADQAQSPNARGIPLGAHAMLTAWAADALAAEGIDVTIEWASVDA